jgi:hypothetical protein
VIVWKEGYGPETCSPMARVGTLPRGAMLRVGMQDHCIVLHHLVDIKQTLVLATCLGQGESRFSESWMDSDKFAVLGASIEDIQPEEVIRKWLATVKAHNDAEVKP